MLSVKIFTFNFLSENTYILYDETRECVIIDPGCYDKDEKQALTEFISEHSLTVRYLLNTHCHIDHILGNAFIKDRYKTALCIHPIEKEILLAAKLYAPMYGLSLYQETTADKFIDEGDLITFGNTSLSILFVPGHSPGHIVFIDHTQKIVIGGDVLFYRSIGRTDLPGGNHATLIKAIKNKLLKLDDHYVVYPGHGPETTIGDEKKYNQYLNE